jgi:hypothetical protein
LARFAFVAPAFRLRIIFAPPDNVRTVTVRAMDSVRPV